MGSTQDTSAFSVQSRFKRAQGKPDLSIPLERIEEPSNEGSGAKMRLENLPFELVTPEPNLRESSENVMLDVDDGVRFKQSTRAFDLEIDQARHKESLEIRRLEE